MSFGIPTDLTWDISTCPNEELQAGEDSKIIVSRSYPNQIELGWRCSYHIYAPDIEQRILIEFEDILLSPICKEQNVTVTDGVTKRKLGPLCDDKPPPDFVSDSDEVIIDAFIAEESSSDMPTRGYMFKYRWVDKDYAQSLEHMISEFTNAAYEDELEGNSFGSWSPRGKNRPITRAPLPSSFMNFGPREFNPPNFDGQSFSPSVPRRPQRVKDSLNVPVFRTDGGVLDKNGKLNLYPVGSPLGPPAPTRQPATVAPVAVETTGSSFTTQDVFDLLNINGESGGEKWWTIPKLIALGAAVACLIALITLFIQFLVRRAEKKIKCKFEEHPDDNSSISKENYVPNPPTRKSLKKKIKKQRLKRYDGKFDEGDLRKAQCALEIQRLQKKLMKYS